MDEFEKLEEDLKVLYDAYVIKSRNIGYLENVLDQMIKSENEKREMQQASSWLL